MSVASIIQQSKRMRRIILSFVPCPALPYIFALSHERQDLSEKIIELFFSPSPHSYRASWYYRSFIYSPSAALVRCSPVVSRYNDWLRAGRSGIESRWGRDLPPLQTSPGAHPASCIMGTASFPGKEAVGVWGWPPTPPSAKVLEKSRAIPLLTQRTWVAYRKDENLLFILRSTQRYTIINWSSRKVPIILVRF